MISIPDILHPSQINLALVGKDQAAGIDEVLSKLNGDSRVRDWNELSRLVTERNAPAIASNGCGICIAHARTNAVSSLVMAVGRSTDGLLSPEVSEPVRLVFVAGIPAAFSSEYLRIVGAIARFCHDQSLLEKLLHIQDPQDFIDLLARQESKL